jgi:hypothetical protein
LKLAPDESIVLDVAPKGRHMRSNPQLPLATLDADLEKIIKKGKSSQEIFSVAVLGTFGQLPDSILNTQVAVSSIPPLPSTEVSRNLDFESFPVEYYSFKPELKEENFEILSSHDIVKWFRLESLEYFPTLGFSTPPPIKISITKEGETSSPL